MDFVALDFEKANRYSNSICSIGLVVFENGQPTDEKNYLVQPPNNRYDLSWIHNITPEDTKDSPVFSELWDELKPYFTELPLVAHNAMSVERAYITKTLEHYDINVPFMRFICTMELSKRFFSYVPSYSLSHICKILNIDFDEIHHHDALYDAKKAGEVLLRMKESFMLSDDFEPIYADPSKRKAPKQRARKIPAEYINPNLEIEDQSHLFFGKIIVITGSFDSYPDRSVMAKLIYSVGGDNNTSISRKTDFVVVGKSPGPSKMKKVEELGITIIDEREFKELFSD